MPVPEKLIFEYSHAGRGASDQWPHDPGPAALAELPLTLRRARPPELPEVGELEAVRHFTRLSQLNFSIDTHFYPLGSCTMKYNPRACNQYAMLPEFLKEVTGMQGVALSPMAGAHGEFAGVAMIRAYHQARGDLKRNEIIVPEAAHGTNPATATMCGCVVREIPVDRLGDVDLAALQAAVGPSTAGIMLTNPSTLGVFERRIGEVARIVHEAGGLLYYDGANLNAILGKVRPGDMGFDVIHMNLHKTFSTPHGGGGPGAGPLVVAGHLVDFLPAPVVVRDGDRYRWDSDRPRSIGRVHGWNGNFGILVRAFAYLLANGGDGLRGVAER